MIDGEAGTLHNRQSNKVACTTAHEKEFNDYQIFEDQDNDQKQDENNQQEKGSGIVGTALNLINTTVGTGTLGLPFVLNQTGVIFGSIGILISGLFGYVTGDLVLRTKNMTQKTSYMQLAQASFNRRGYWMVIISQVITNLGVSLGYAVIMGLTGQNLMTQVSQNCPPISLDKPRPYYCERWFYPASIGLLVLPLSFAKNMSVLQSLSFLKLIALICFTLITVGYFIYAWTEGILAENISWKPDFTNLVDGLGSVNIVTMSCSYQFNLIPIYKSLNPRTDSNMKKSILLSSGMSCLLYILVAISGYAALGQASENLLKGFTSNNLGSLLYMLLQGSFFVACVLSFPVAFFEARNAMVEICSQRRMSRGDRIQQEGENSNRDVISMATVPYVIVVTSMHLTVMLIAALAPDINSIFTIIGSTTMNGFVYLFPSLFYLKISKQKGGLRHWARFFMIFGLVMLVFGVWSSINGFSKKK